MERLAIFASTVFEAARLLDAERTAEDYRVAASVAGQALEFASADARRWVEGDLRRHNQIGDERDQYPQDPWLMWQNERIFNLLKSADFPEVEQITRLPATRLVAMGPVAILAALGAPHRRLRVPPWVTAGVVGTLVGLGAVLMLRKGERENVFT